MPHQPTELLQPTIRAWLAAAIPVAVLAIITVVTAEPERLSIVPVMIGGPLLAALAVIGACAVVAGNHRHPESSRAVLTGMIALVLMIIVHALPELPALAALDGSWQAKLLNLCWVAILLAGWPAGRRAAGVTLRLVPGSIRPAVIAAAAGCVAWFALGVLGAWAGLLGRPSPTLLAYQLVLPGLDEELIFRGVLLAVLTAAFGTPWRFFGVPAGWGLAAVTILFGALHGLTVVDGQLTVNLLAAVLTTPVGLLLAWIRLRTGSIWPAVLTHNAINTTHLLGTLLI